MPSDIQIRLKIITESRFDKKRVDGLPRIGMYAVQEIRERLIRHKINASGRTARSLRYSIGGEKQLKILADAGNRAPIETLQYGRPGGKVPKGFHAIITQWILDKRISYSPIPYIRKESRGWKPKYTPEERGLNALAGAISAKIKKEGTARFHNPDTDVYSPVLEEVIEIFTNFVASRTEQTIIKALMQ